MATFPSVEDIKSFQRNEKPTEDDQFYGDALDAAVQTMNDECQRQFVVAPAADHPDLYTARTFVPNPRSDVLYVGDFIDATTVVENGTTLTVSSAHQFEPVARVNAAGVEVPYNTIRRFGVPWYTYGPRGTVVVTAAWGWATIPTRVVEAVKIITKDVIENRDVVLGLVAVTEAAGIVARTNPVVASTIRTYRGIESWGIA